jgi:hypothetical protein
MDVSSQLDVPADLPSEKEAAWTLPPVRTFWIREKSVAPAGKRILDSPARGLATVTTVLFRLPF